jgi:hypothetical protein
MKFKYILPFLVVVPFFASCASEDPRYAMVRLAIDQLRTDVEENVYMRFIYHGQPPLDDKGIVVLLRFSYYTDDQLLQASYAYFNESETYVGGFANELYGYRSQYAQLSATKMNEEYGLTL